MLRKKLKLSENEENSDNKRQKVTNSNICSKYFNTIRETAIINTSNIINSQLLCAVKDLNNIIKDLKFKDPIVYCYNPMEYAIKSFEQYINKYCNTRKSILFVGMNPGPFGMCQTGIPFGNVPHVRNWMKINADVTKPEKECPDRPVLGLSCTRNEISGQKFWGLFEKLCETPEKFFQTAFVWNYCPLAFMQRNGGNITPNRIKVVDSYSFVAIVYIIFFVFSKSAMRITIIVLNIFHLFTLLFYFSRANEKNSGFIITFVIL